MSAMAPQITGTAIICVRAFQALACHLTVLKNAAAPSGLSGTNRGLERIAKSAICFLT